MTTLGESPFTGIKLHNIDVFPNFEKFSIKDIKSILRSTNELKRRGIFWDFGYSPSVASKFRVNIDFLTQICEILKNDKRFSSCELIRHSSDIGLPNYILAKHHDGSELVFDGFIIRASKEITSEKIQYNKILELTGYPPIQSRTIDDFFYALHESNPTFPSYGSIGFAYYTFNETNWEKLGLTRDGPAQGALIVNDPHIITTTALIFTEFGKKFWIYFGDESHIHQMICLETFIRFELNRISSLFSQYLSQLYGYYNKTILEYGGLALPNYAIIKKMRKWNDIKKMIITLFDIIDITENAGNYLNEIKKIINQKNSFINGPNQILQVDSKENHVSVIHHQISNFFMFQLNSDQQIENLKTQVKVLYDHEWHEVDEKVRFTKNLEDNLYIKCRDLQTAYQTEFSIYAIYAAIIALIITAILQIFTTYLKF